MSAREVSIRLRVLRGHSRSLSRTATPGKEMRRRRRLRCADVARNRAKRYATQRRIAKQLWPLIATFILIGLIFERRHPPASSWIGGRPVTGDDIKSAASTSDDEQGIDRRPDPGDIGSAVQGIREPQYRPSSDFLAKDVAQVLAFLVRNRGRIDNEAVRAKWNILDRVCLPLAVYLREVEADGAWDDLERDIKAAPIHPSGLLATGMPRSPWHRKIFALLPEWSRRGEELMSNATTEEPSAEHVPADDADKPDTDPPKP